MLFFFIEKTEGVAMQTMTPVNLSNQSQTSKVAPLDSIVLQRLLDEVKRENTKAHFVGGNFDRVHNRHNR